MLRDLPKFNPGVVRNRMTRLFTVSKTGGGDPNKISMGNLMVCTLTTNPTIIISDKKKDRGIQNNKKRSDTRV